jgi:hypothetical protein
MPNFKIWLFVLCKKNEIKSITKFKKWQAADGFPTLGKVGKFLSVRHFPLGQD